MTKQIDEIMRLVDDLLETEHAATRKGGRAFLKSALEAALKPGEPVAFKRGYEEGLNDTIRNGIVWAREYFGVAPPAQTPCGYDETTGNCTNSPCCYGSYTAPPAQPDVKPVEPIGYRYKYLNFMGDEVWAFDPPRNGKVLETVPVYTDAPPVQTQPRLAIGQLCEAIKKSRGYVTDDEVVMARAIESAVRKQFGVNDE